MVAKKVLLILIRMASRTPNSKITSTVLKKWCQTLEVNSAVMVIKSIMPTIISNLIWRIGPPTLRESMELESHIWTYRIR